MKSLLVLYPIQPYANALIGEDESAERKAKYARIYQHLVCKRYPGFQLIWVMFSDPQSPERPDVSQLWQGISIKEDDIVWPCGVSLNEHCKKRLYPKSEVILSACPQPIEELVICGFHFWDCVEKVAKYAHRQGISVLVDDDLTEFFFWKVKSRKRIPSSSCIPLLKRESIEKDRRQFIKFGGSFQLERIREARKGKPWLVSI